MADQGYHEIQLSGKQLVFLFMCAVVLTVVVFLFGVSVGRGANVSSVQAATPPPATTDTVVPADTPPPPTQTSPKELSYADVLAGGDSSKAAPPAPAAEPPPVATTEPAPAPKAEPAPAKTEPVPPAPQKQAPLQAAPAPAAKTPAKTAPALNGFYVQVGAFAGIEVASQQVTKLQAKGYPAYVFTEPEGTPGPRYKVRVGPYSARPQAEETRRNLVKEGYNPFIQR